MITRRFQLCYIVLWVLAILTGIASVKSASAKSLYPWFSLIKQWGIEPAKRKFHQSRYAVFQMRAGLFVRLSCHPGSSHVSWNLRVFHQAGVCGFSDSLVTGSHHVEKPNLGVQLTTNYDELPEILAQFSNGRWRFATEHQSVSEFDGQLEPGCYVWEENSGNYSKSKAWSTSTLLPYSSTPTPTVRLEFSSI